MNPINASRPSTAAQLTRSPEEKPNVVQVPKIKIGWHAQGTETGPLAFRRVLEMGRSLNEKTQSGDLERFAGGKLPDGIERATRGYDSRQGYVIPMKELQDGAVEGNVLAVKVKNATVDAMYLFDSAGRQLAFGQVFEPRKDYSWSVMLQPKQPGE